MQQIVASLEHVWTVIFRNISCKDRLSFLLAQLGWHILDFVMSGIILGLSGIEKVICARFIRPYHLVASKHETTQITHVIHEPRLVR